MLKVRTTVANGTLADDHVAAERWARRPLHPATETSQSWTVSRTIPEQLSPR